MDKLNKYNGDAIPLPWLCQYVGRFDNFFAYQCYPIYPKYWYTLPPYHTCPKIWSSPFCYLLMCVKTAECVANSVDPDVMPILWSSGFTLFAQASLSQNLE